jgi:hypothetical protein
METNRYRSLLERSGRKELVKDRGLAHTQKRRGKKKCHKKTDIHESTGKNSST